MLPIMLAMMNGGGSPGGGMAELKKLMYSMLFFLWIMAIQSIHHSKAVRRAMSIVKNKILKRVHLMFVSQHLSKPCCRRDIDGVTVSKNGAFHTHNSPREFIPVIKDIAMRVMPDRHGLVVKDIMVDYNKNIPCCFREHTNNDNAEWSLSSVFFTNNVEMECDIDMAPWGYPDLKLGLSHEQETNGEEPGKGMKAQDSNWCLTVSRYRVTMVCDRYDTITRYVKNCVKTFELETRRMTFDDPKMFVLERVREPSNHFFHSTVQLDYTCIDYRYEQTFDNKFFTHKEELRSICHNFVKNRSKHKELGIQHTLGVCLHGCPGSGKTSAINAFCRERSLALGGVPVHMFIINVSLITNVRILRSILTNDYVNNVYVPHDRRVYVLEEVDCSAWKDIISSRRKCVSTSLFDKYEDETKSSHGENGTGKKKKKKKTYTKRTGLDEDEDDDEDNSDRMKKGTILSSSDFPLTLGQILETLDGMIKRDGHVIFMTTNYISEIDEALLRPGRFDFIFELGPLPKSCIAEMYSQWFDGDKMPRSVYMNTLSSVFTQADVGYIFTHDRETIHRMLSSNHKDGSTRQNIRKIEPPSLCTSYVGLRSHPLHHSDVLTEVTEVIEGNSEIV